MAVIKDFQTNFGITANYHRLLKVEIISENKMIELVVGVYVSEEARNQGGVPLWHEYVRIPFNNLSLDPRDIFYPLLKQYNQSYLFNSLDSISPGTTVHPPVFEIVESPPPTPIITPNM